MRCYEVKLSMVKSVYIYFTNDKIRNESLLRFMHEFWKFLYLNTGKSGVKFLPKIVYLSLKELLIETFLLTNLLDKHKVRGKLVALFPIETFFDNEMGDLLTNSDIYLIY